MRCTLLVSVLLVAVWPRDASADEAACTSELPEELNPSTVRGTHRAAAQDAACTQVLKAKPDDPKYADCKPLLEKAARFCNAPLLADLGSPDTLVTPEELEAARLVIEDPATCSATRGGVSAQGGGAFGLATSFQDDLLRGLASFIVARAKAEALAWAIDELGKEVCGNPDAAALLPNSCELLTSADPSTPMAWGTLKTAFETDLERFPERAMACVAVKSGLEESLRDLLVTGVQIVRLVREGEDPLAVLAGLDEQFPASSCPKDKLRCGMHVLGLVAELLAPGKEGVDESANELRIAQIAARRLWEQAKELELIPEADDIEKLVKKVEETAEELRALEQKLQDALTELAKATTTKKRKAELEKTVSDLEKEIKTLTDGLPAAKKAVAKIEALADALLDLYRRIRGVADKVKRVQEAIDQAGADAERAQSVVRVARAVVDLIDAALALVPDTQFGEDGAALKKKADQILDVLDEAAVAVDSAIGREYARAFVHVTAAVNLLAGMMGDAAVAALGDATEKVGAGLPSKAPGGQPGPDAAASAKATAVAKSQLPSAIARYGPFIAEVAAAKTPEDVQRALEAVAAPVGGSLAKRGKGRRTVAINAFLGLHGGGEVVDAPGGDTIVGGHGSLYAAVGVEASMGVRTHGSIGLFLSVIDLGALTSLHFGDLEDEMSGGDGEVETTPEVGVAQVFSPGLYFVASCARISFGFGASLTPKLRNVTEDGMFVEEASALRFGAFIALDITIFPF